MHDPNCVTALWTRAMYETCWQWDRVAPLLETHATAGSFRRYSAASRFAWGAWHYSGTFYWFRNRDAFRRNWQYVPQRFFGTEAWPGLMFRPEEAGVIACDNIRDLYQLPYWRQTIEPELQQWRANNATRQIPMSQSTTKQ